MLVATGPKHPKMWFAWRPYFAQSLGQAPTPGGIKGALGGAYTHPLRVVLRATGVLVSPTRLRLRFLRQHCWSRAEDTRWGCSVENSASPHTVVVFGIWPRGVRCDETSVRRSWATGGTVCVSARLVAMCCHVHTAPHMRTEPLSAEMRGMRHRPAEPH